MSSTESSGASAEATATNPASTAAASFGSTRGSGLARGKGKRHTAPAAATAASSDYTPTAIAVVTAPREYQNPFAPVETPAAVAPEVAVSAEAAVKADPAPVAPAAVKIESTPAVAEHVEPAVESTPAADEADEHAELNILPPEQPRNAPAQTWESEGFRPAREPRGDRARREESRRDEPRPERAPRQEIPIPEKFLYVRPGYNYVPTPSNYGGAPRERDTGPSASPAYVAPAAAPEKSGGFLGWLKSLFGGSTPAPAVPAGRSNGDPRHGDRPQGGRNQGGGHRRRSRGGRGRNHQRGEFNRGDQGGSSAT